MTIFTLNLKSVDFFILSLWFVAIKFSYYLGEWQIVELSPILYRGAKTEWVDGNSFGFAFNLVEESQSFIVFCAKHNLLSFKFSTKVWERAMLVNTPIFDAYKQTIWLLIFYLESFCPNEVCKWGLFELIWYFKYMFVYCKPYVWF